MLCACRLKAIENIAYFVWKVSSGFEKFEKKDLYYRNAMAVKMLEMLIEYRVERKKDENKSQVDGTVMHLTRLGA